jgi:hypothetical protein
MAKKMSPTKAAVWKSLDAAIRKLGRKLDDAGLPVASDVKSIAKIDGHSAAAAAEAPLNRAYLSANSLQRTTKLAQAASALWGAAKTAADPSNPPEWAKAFIDRALAKMR